MKILFTTNAFEIERMLYYNRSTILIVHSALHLRWSKFAGDIYEQAKAHDPLPEGGRNVPPLDDGHPAAGPHIPAPE